MRNRLTLLTATLLAVSLFVAMLAVGVHVITTAWPIPAARWYALRHGWSHLFVISLALGGAALLFEFRHSVWRAIRNFFSITGSPVDLAVTRIAVTLALFYFLRPIDYAWHTSLPDSLIVPPVGLNWFYECGLFDVRVAANVRSIFLPLSLLAAVGLFTRVTMPIFAVSALYLAAIPQFDGKVDHVMHMLVLFACILAVSPCGDALSVDALLRRRPRPQNSLCYTLPLRFCWLLLGTTYFFPGLWKVWDCGLDWIFSDHLRLIIHRKWLSRPYLIPTFRYDQYPSLLMLSAAGTLVFELGFLFCLFSTRWRWFAVIVANLFHLGVRLVLGIPFYGLQVCYVSFIPWSKLFPSRRTSLREETANRRLWPAALLGSLLLSGNILTGFQRELDTYPISCFPTFAELNLSPVATTIEIREVGAPRPLPREQLRRLRYMGPTGVAYLHRRILKEPDPEKQQQMLRDLKSLLGLSNTVDVEYYEIRTSIDPDAPHLISQKRIEVASAQRPPTARGDNTLSDRSTDLDRARE